MSDPSTLTNLLQSSLRKTTTRWGRRDDKKQEMSAGERKQEEAREKRSTPGWFNGLLSDSASVLEL